METAETHPTLESTPLRRMRMINESSVVVGGAFMVVSLAGQAYAGQFRSTTTATYPLYRCPKSHHCFVMLPNLLLGVSCNSPEDSRKRVQRRLVAGTPHRLWTVPRRQPLFPSDPCYGTLPCAYR